MSPSDHETLWGEAPVTFLRRYENMNRWYRERNPGKQPHELVETCSPLDAEQYTMPMLRIFSPDWEELDHADRSQHRFNSTWNDHNWWRATRFDITYFPAAAPFIYYGRLITGGHNCTFKLRRLRATHQATRRLGIPGDASLTYLGDNITLAKWTERRHARLGWENRTVHREAYLTRGSQGWLAAATYEECIAAAVLARLNLPQAA